MPFSAVRYSEVRDVIVRDRVIETESRQRIQHAVQQMDGFQGTSLDSRNAVAKSVVLPSTFVYVWCVTLCPCSTCAPCDQVPLVRLRIEGRILHEVVLPVHHVVPELQFSRIL